MLIAPCMYWLVILPSKIKLLFRTLFMFFASLDKFLRGAVIDIIMIVIPHC